jgi:hypothetical protein
MSKSQSSIRQPAPSNQYLSDAQAKLFWKSVNPTPFPKEKRTPFPQVGYLINSVNSLGQLKQDLKDLVLLQLYSGTCLTSHPSMIGRQRHEFFRTRTSYSKQPEKTASPSKDNQAKKDTPTNRPPASKPAPKGKAAIAAIIEAKVIPDASNLDHTSFSTTFPGTTFPHLSLLNGLPKCNKATFNSLLTSKLRAAKKVLGLKATDRLEKELVLFVSRRIDKMFTLVLEYRKQQALDKKKNPRTPSSAGTHSKAESPVAPKKTKKQKKTASRTIEFVSPAPPTIESLQETIASLQRQIEALKVQPAPVQEPTTSSSTQDAQSIQHISLKEVETVQKLLSDSRNLKLTDKLIRHVQPMGPKVLSRCLVLKHDSLQYNKCTSERLGVLHTVLDSIASCSITSQTPLNDFFSLIDTLDTSRLDNEAIDEFRKLRPFSWTVSDPDSLATIRSSGYDLSKSADLNAYRAMFSVLSLASAKCD